jgi:phospholipid/cholesterol/gamma-HCH transport system ATP-binding protein
MTLIELKKVSKRFGSQQVLDQVDLSIESGKCLVILGASGSGKSVLLKHIVRLLRPDSGEVWFSGQRIDNLPDPSLVHIRRRFGFLFQGAALFDSMNVLDNVAFPLVESGKVDPVEIERVALDKLNMVNLPDIGQKMPAELSGGQRKRVGLARAIAMDPEAILYDEPTTGLDPIRSDVINELIIKLQKTLKVTSIVVTHDMHSAFKIADRIVMLHMGKLIFDGTAEQIRNTDNSYVKDFVEGKATPEEVREMD